MPEQLDNEERCMVRSLVQMLTPCKGRAYDPCCDSAAMFVQNKKFVEKHGGRIDSFAAQFPNWLWFFKKNNAVGFENNARLFGGETELSLVA